MTKEEIFMKHSKIIYDANDYGTRVLTERTYENAMQEYADQQTSELKAELAEYKERYECNQHTVINQQGTINDLKNELNELKERHKILFDKIIDVSSQQRTDEFKFAVSLNLAQQMKLQYYKQKFESND